jgi:hypothetical protein
MRISGSYRRKNHPINRLVVLKYERKYPLEEIVRNRISGVNFSDGLRAEALRILEERKRGFNENEEKREE